jgi:hypothetical protein
MLLKNSLRLLDHGWEGALIGRQAADLDRCQRGHRVRFTTTAALVSELIENAPFLDRAQVDVMFSIVYPDSDKRGRRAAAQLRLWYSCAFCGSGPHKYVRQTVQLDPGWSWR